MIISINGTSYTGQTKQRRKIIIAVSGIPGTGKSSVSKLLARRMNANLISISVLIRKYKTPYDFDKERNTKVIDTKDVRKAVKKALSKNKINIIEGHLAHFIPAKMTFVLVCDPLVLRKRLQKRRWSAQKIDENVLAEILQIVQSEAKSPYIINTTKLSSEKASEKILKIIKNPESYRHKEENWLKKYKKLVIGMKYRGF